jgi:hypothetical protein
MDAAILVDVWLAFVRVDDDKLRRIAGFAPALPLDTSREACTAATAKAGKRILNRAL